VLLLPPSGAEPDRLVMICSHSAHQDIGKVSYPDYEYLRKNNHVFTDIAAAPNSIGLNVDFDHDGRAVKLATRPVSENYFAVLGIKPFLGRFFTAGETAESSNEAVMSWPCWMRLGSRRDVIGQPLAGWTIVGAAPPSFTGGFYGANGDLFGSLRHDQDRSWMGGSVAGEFSVDRAIKAGGDAGAGANGDGDPRGPTGERISKGRQGEDGRGDPGDAAAARCHSGPDGGERSSDAAGAAGAVDRVRECGELDAGRGDGTRQEAVIKLAIGAPRGRLIREFLWESAALCAMSGALGYGMAAAVSGWLKNFSYVFPIWGSFSFSIILRLDGAT
jgi:hypothetical protein